MGNSSASGTSDFCNIDADNTPEEKFIQECRNGNEAGVRRCIEEKIDVNTTLQVMQLLIAGHRIYAV
jgi:hypothetical protein